MMIFHQIVYVNPSLAASLEPLVDVHLNWLNWFHLLILAEGPLVILIVCKIFISPFLNLQDVYVNRFFPRTPKLWNSLPAECFSLTDYLNDFKGCVRYIFTDLFCIYKESICKTRKNVFYFTSKTLFVLEIIKF